MSAVTFCEESHTYTDPSGNNLVSATTLIGKYKPKFDSNTHAERVARREGLTKEIVLGMWEDEKNRACEYGTHIHKVMEDFLSEGVVDDEYTSLYESYKSFERVFDGFKTLSCEKLLYNIDYGVAGTADLIYEKGDSFFIGDFKTNKKFRFYNSYNEYFHDPISHLSVCEFNTYGLQLSLYAYLHERATGKKCRGLVIFYMRNNKWYPIRCNYMKSEIVNMLDHNKSQP